MCEWLRERGPWVLEEDEEAELGEVRKQIKIRPGLRAQWRGPSQARR